MLETLILGFRSAFAGVRNQFVSSVRSAMLENIVIKEAGRHLEIMDKEGRLARVRRYRKYEIRWYSPDYFSPQRITLETPTGRIKSLRVTEPQQLDYEILEGGIGE